VAGFAFAATDFALGIFFGGLLVTVNFHLLARTLRRALTPPQVASHNVVPNTICGSWSAGSSFFC
jgi:hypothetical protein